MERQWDVSNRAQVAVTDARKILVANDVGEKYWLREERFQEDAKKEDAQARERFVELTMLEVEKVGVFEKDDMVLEPEQREDR